MSTSSITPPVFDPPRTAVRQVMTTLQQLPFTSLVVALIVTVNVVAADPHLWAYGPSDLASWRIVDFLLGVFVVPGNLLVPVVVGLVAVSLGFLEQRVGGRRTAAVFFGTHLAGSVGTAVLVQIGAAVGSDWAAVMTSMSDTGASAGALGVLAFAWARTPTRARTGGLLLIGAYLGVVTLRSGLLWDVEHLLSFGAGMALARRTAPSADATYTGVDRLTVIRWTGASVVAAVGATSLVAVVYPGFGGVLGDGAPASSPMAVMAIGVATVTFVLADALRRGRHIGWMLTSVIAGVVAFSDTVAAELGTQVCATVVIGLAIAHAVVAHRAVQASAAPEDDSLEDRLTIHGGGSLGWMGTWAPMETWTAPDGLSIVGYRRSAGVAIVIGAPVCPPALQVQAAAAFEEHCLARGLTVAWYAVGDDFASAATAAGWSHLHIGEDAVLDLDGLEFRGKAWQDIRTARNRATRDGITMQVIHLEQASADVVAQVHEISDAWSADKPLPEMGFTLGGVAEAMDPAVRTHMAIDEGGIVQGVTTWLPIHRDGRIIGWTLDLMRRRPNGFAPVIEFLVAESIVAFQSEGFRSVSLSVAPLARCHRDGTTLTDRGLTYAGQLLEPVYGFDSLMRFKAKFQAEHRPVHLVHRDPLDLPLIGAAIGHAYLPTMTTRDLLTAARLVRAGRTVTSSAGGRSDGMAKRWYRPIRQVNTTSAVGEAGVIPALTRNRELP